MGKHKEKKRKSGDLSETVSASPPASEKLQKGHVRTNNDAESPVTDILKSLESFSKKPKKKKKKKHLSEQDAGSDAEAPREHVKVKQEETFKQEAVNDIEIDEHFANTEEPTRKKKKRKRAKEVNEATESVAQSNENSGEPSPKKKKKKRHVSDENTAEEVNLTSKGTQSSADVGKKKKHKSKDKKARPVFTTQETFPKTSRQNMKENNSEIEMASESPLIDPNLLMQLKEFIPDIESKEQVNVSKMIKYDLPRFQEFKQQAEGIPRSCFYIYARGRRMFDEQNYQGEFSKAELKNLNKFHTLHGNNWKKISELTGRSALALQKRYTQIADKEGPWSEKEVQRLLRAVHDYIVSQIPGGANRRGSIRVMKETLYKRLPLQKIAMKVKTRSWTQCREKWMYEMDIDDAARVNWEDLTAQIG
ncbi:transcription termination factor 1 isoform X2 [Silurus meridionalis]|nr:transcription termination factor 1 isoform X2 [Silurus meridionalis]